MSDRVFVISEKALREMLQDTISIVESNMRDTRGLMQDTINCALNDGTLAVRPNTKDLEEYQ